MAPQMEKLTQMLREASRVAEIASMRAADKAAQVQQCVARLAEASARHKRAMEKVERGVAKLLAANEAASATPPVIVPFAPLPKEEAEEEAKDEADAPEGAPQKRRRCAPKEQAEAEAEATEVTEADVVAVLLRLRHAFEDVGALPPGTTLLNQ